MRYIGSIFNFGKVANNVDSSEFMLTSMAGYSHYPIDGRMIESILCLFKKQWVLAVPNMIQLLLQLKDVKSYGFEQEVTTIRLLAHLATDDVAHGSIDGTDDQLVFVKQSPTDFSLLLLADDARPAEHVAQKIIDGNQEIKAELELLRQETREVPNIFDAYTARFLMDTVIKVYRWYTFKSNPNENY